MSYEFKPQLFIEEIIQVCTPWIAMEIMDPCSTIARGVMVSRCKAVQLSCVLQWEGVEVILFYWRKFVAWCLKVSDFSKVWTITLQILQSYGAGLEISICHAATDRLKSQTHTVLFSQLIAPSFEKYYTKSTPDSWLSSGGGLSTDP